jgi:lysozyme
MTTKTPLKDRAFGIDVSKWQIPIDWNAIAIHNPTVRFAGIRASISYLYRDPIFIDNWAECKRVDILRMAYHVLYPAENATAQMDNLFSQLNNDFGEMPLILDVELDHGCGKNQITQSILDCAAIIEKRTGKKPIIYARAIWIDDHTNVGSWRSSFDWWLAQYYAKPRHREEYPEPTRLPAGVFKWLIHQNCKLGAPFGVGSAALDYNRFNGTANDLHKYAGELPTTPPENPPELDALSKQVINLINWAENINYKRG